MKYLIDTNICIYIMNKRPAKVIKKFKHLDMGEVGISTITISELQYGVSKSEKKGLNRQRLNEFLTPLEVFTYDVLAAEAYGDIRIQLESSGQPIGPLDMLIAAQAISRNLILVTNNETEFKRIENLKVKNWA